jgi:hypothetical protein
VAAAAELEAAIAAVTPGIPLELELEALEFERVPDIF